MAFEFTVDHRRHMAPAAAQSRWPPLMSFSGCRTLMPLLAQSRHELVHRTCLRGVKRTCRFALPCLLLTQSGHWPL